MGPFYIDVNPILVQFGVFELRWYGLATMLGIMAAIWVALRRARRVGLNEEALYSLALWAVLGGIAGARLFHVVDKIDYYRANPVAILAFQQGGLAIWGGLLGGTLAAALCARLRGLNIPEVADLVAPGLPIGQSIGRLGCIINGDVAGSPTDSPLAFVYTHPQALAPQLGVPTHPYPAYEILWNLAVLGVLLALRRRLPRPGLLFLSYAALYAAGRFLLTFVRQENVWLLGLQQAQVISLAIILAAVLVGSGQWAVGRRVGSRQ